MLFRSIRIILITSVLFATQSEQAHATTYPEKWREFVQSTARRVFHDPKEQAYIIDRLDAAALEQLWFLVGRLYLHADEPEIQFSKHIYGTLYEVLGGTVFRDQYRGRDDVRIFSDRELFATDPAGSRPDGIAIVKWGGRWRLLAIYESKTGWEGFSEAQAEKYIKSWKKSGLVIDGLNVLIPSTLSLARTGKPGPIKTRIYITYPGYRLLPKVQYDAVNFHKLTVLATPESVRSFAERLATQLRGPLRQLLEEAYMERKAFDREVFRKNEAEAREKLERKKMEKAKKAQQRVEPNNSGSLPKKADSKFPALTHWINKQRRWPRINATEAEEITHAEYMVSQGGKSALYNRLPKALQNDVSVRAEVFPVELYHELLQRSDLNKRERRVLRELHVSLGYTGECRPQVENMAQSPTRSLTDRQDSSASPQMTEIDTLR